jgi:hypothetical protein
MPDGYILLVKESPIHGSGAFAHQHFGASTLIAPARMNGMRTPAGRYVNHSPTPNAQYFPLDNGDLHLIATFDIAEGDEITVDYRQAIAANRIASNPVHNFPAIIAGCGLNLSEMSNRQKIEVAEFVMSKSASQIPADDLETRNFVHAGMYARELTIPAGVAITGKIHTEAHLCILSQGDISIMTDDGMQRIQAPAIFETAAGTKKLGFAHELSVFTTIHATNETELQIIESALLSDSDLTWINDLMIEKAAICQQ